MKVILVEESVCLVVGIWGNTAQFLNPQVVELAPWTEVAGSAQPFNTTLPSSELHHGCQMERWGEGVGGVEGRGGGGS